MMHTGTPMSLLDACACLYKWRFLSLAVLVGALTASSGCNRGAGVRSAGKPRAETATIETVATGTAARTFENISHDGRLVSYTDWDGGGDLYVRDFAGERGTDLPDSLARVGDALRRITKSGSWSESSSFANHSVLSPDGRSVAWMWFNQDGFALKVQSIDGDEPITLYPAGRVGFPPVWSPDGRQIALSISVPGGANKIALIDVEGGGFETLDVGTPPVGKLTYSPDGRHLMLETLTHEARPERDILAVSLTDGQVTKLVEHPADDFILGWSPDASYILFGSTRGGPISAWAQPVSDGNPVGAPVQISADIGTSVTPVGFVDSGDFYFAVQAGQQDDLFLATLDADGRSSTRAQHVAKVAAVSAPEFSPDGDDIAFLRQRGANAALPFGSEVIVRSVVSGEERVLPPLKLHRMNAGSGVVTKPRWSPDRRHFLFQGFNNLGDRGLHLVRTDTGDMKLIHRHSPRVPSWLVDWSADGQRTFEIQQDYRPGGVGLWQVQSRDLESGAVERLADYNLVTHIAQALATSPDGRWIAYAGSFVKVGESEWGTSSVLVIPSAGGKVRELYRASPPEFVTGLDWSPDSSRLLFGRSRIETGQERFQLSDIALEGGDVRNLGLSMEGGYLQGLSVHPGGRQIAFTVGAMGSREVRALRGLSAVMLKR